MSQKSSLPQVTQFVSRALMPDRLERRLCKAVAPAMETPPGVSGHLAGFTRWFDASFVRSGHIEGLHQHDVERFRQMAWHAYHGTLDNPNLWVRAIRVLNDRHREAGVLAEAAYWRVWSKS